MAVECLQLQIMDPLPARESAERRPISHSHVDQFPLVLTSFHWSCGHQAKKGQEAAEPALAPGLSSDSSMSCNGRRRPTSDRSGPLVLPLPATMWHELHCPSPKKNRSPFAVSPSGGKSKAGALRKRIHCARVCSCFSGRANGGMPPGVPFRINSWICDSERSRRAGFRTSDGPRSAPLAPAP